MQPSLFIGLVTHPKSRFPAAAGPSGLMATLADEMRSLDWAVTCSVADQDEIDDTAIDVTRAAVAASIAAELATEARWRAFQRTLGLRAKLLLELRGVFRRGKYLGTSSRASSLGRTMLIRLANIEAAHLRLLKQGEDSGAQWTLILEDDAYAPEVSDLAGDLHRHLTRWTTTRQPKYVNVSRSFPLSRLRLGSSLIDEGAWNASARVLSSTIPFTNTVCAILYRAEFLQQLNRALDEIPMQPIVPIDWKVNLAIMDLTTSGLLGSSDCYVIDPAPISQGSMHRTATVATAG